LWCQSKKCKILPSTPENVALYIKNCAEIQKLKISTIQRRISAISEAHKRNGFDSPTLDWLVKNTLKRLKREYGAPAKGKKPTLVNDLRRKKDTQENPPKQATNPKFLRYRTS
jgi:hypothetical protein